IETFAGETGTIDLSYPAFTWTKLHGFAVPRENPVKAEDITLEEAMNMAGEYPSMNDEHPFSTLWTIHIDKEWRKWSVLGRFASIPLEESNIALENVGLERNKEYLAFDFWGKKYLGKVSGRFTVKKLDLGT
ncbi:hypothetical protein, partial [Clostridium perfringens]|uniref:hypothetical protein n=1 Tax=Clostridium perfringens TaxID=1502 RepID=UPI002ACD6A2D